MRNILIAVLTVLFLSSTAYACYSNKVILYERTFSGSYKIHSVHRSMWSCENRKGLLSNGGICVCLKN